MPLTRRAALAGLVSAAALPRHAGAQAFPTRAVTIVVPYPPGGPVDLVARVIAQEIAGDLGQSVLVDNRAGAAGVVGTAAVARAEPDGHTLVLGTNQTHATNESLIKTTPYRAVKDFAPVAGIAEIPHVLVVRKDLGVADAAALVKLAKERPGALNVGSTGNGSASHLTAELFKVRTATALQHVPFRGAAPMVQELLAGRIDLAFATLPSVYGQVAAGELKALAAASGRRAAPLPQVPTLKEAGIEGVEADAWFALFAPAGTPAAVVERLAAAVTTALAREAPKATLAKQGLTLALRRPAEVAATLPAEVEKWAAVVKAANLSAE